MGRWRTGRYDGTEAFEIIPDIRLRKTGNDRPRAVIDTKWKRLNPKSKTFGISNTDIYQVTAYATALDITEAVLIYPWIGEGSPFGSTTLMSLAVGPTTRPISVTVAFVPMLSRGLGEFRETVANLISALSAD